MKKLLRFTEEFLDNSGKELNRKTKVITVYSNHSGDVLGEIHWRSGWRCYVMSYNPNIDMSLSCNKELNDFMQRLENNRKEKTSQEIK